MENLKPLTKETLRSGQMARLQNGDILMVVYAKSIGYFFITEDGETDSLDNYNEKLECSDHNCGPDFDIVELYDIVEIDSKHSGDWENIIEQGILIAKRVKFDEPTSDESTDNEHDLNRTASIKTQVWIEVNGKPIDPNNMTPYEAKLMVALGMMPMSIFDDNPEYI